MFYTIMQYTNVALVYRMLLVKSTQSLSHRVSLSEAVIQQIHNEVAALKCGKIIIIIYIQTVYNKLGWKIT